MNRSPLRGFTLLEVLIAMAILSFVTIFTAQAISTALKNRTKIQSDIDRGATLRDALRVIENDINKAFHHHDINIELYNSAARERNRKIEEAKAGSQPNGTPGSPPAGGSPAPPTGPTDGSSTIPTQNPYANMEPLKLKEEKLVTQFLGESEKLDFTTLSNARFSSEDRTSDQAEVGYYLKDCKSRKDRKVSSKCLIRRISPILDAETSNGGEDTALLEHVTKLSFKYLGPPAGSEWTNRWTTNDPGDDRTRDIFPYAVEVSIEITPPSEDPKQKPKPLAMTIVAGIRNPNNKDKTATDTQSGDGTPGSSGPGTPRTDR